MPCPIQYDPATRSIAACIVDFDHLALRGSAVGRQDRHVKHSGVFAKSEFVKAAGVGLFRRCRALQVVVFEENAGERKIGAIADVTRNRARA